MSLQIKSLTKTYPGSGGKAAVRALDNVSLSAPKGVFGLLGPNGAGKTTLMNIIATLQDPDSGSADFEGLDVLREKEKLRKILGFLPQEFGVYPHVSAPALLDYLAMLKGIADRPGRKRLVSELLELVNLSQYGERPLGKYSGGMKQRFGIAQALAGSPKLLIVDEPTAGLDPEERTRFYNILSEAGQRAAVLLSTHIVGDVSAVCQNFAIIKEGRILARAKPEQAVGELKGRLWKKTADKPQEAEIKKKRAVLSSRFFMGKSQIRFLSDSDPKDGSQPADPSLEDYYFAVIHQHISPPC